MTVNWISVIFELFKPVFIYYPQITRIILSKPKFKLNIIICQTFKFEKNTKLKDSQYIFLYQMK